MPIQVRGFGWKRDHNDPRDFTPEHKEIHEILTLKGTKNQEKYLEQIFRKKWIIVNGVHLLRIKAI
jgi:hypothetical protein